MSASNYKGLAGGGHGSPGELATSASATEAVLLGERDAVMLSALHHASLRW